MSKTLEILNALAPNGVLHLIIDDNNNCYILENSNIRGNILEESEKHYIILWNYLSFPVYQRYNKINNNKIIKNDNTIIDTKISNKQDNYSKYINLSKKNNYKTLAFYLPQFHEIEENNKNWGNGFTEWTNVSQGQSLFDGHYQPKIPSDFGFYNLEYDKKIFTKQVNLAKSIGIDGFIFYYYRFNDKVLLDKPIKNFLNSDLDSEFALCWANENWTRAWDGLDNDTIVKQDYESNYKKIIDDLSIYFNDKRYIKINNKPLFIIYKPLDIPDLYERIRIWQEHIKQYGFDGIEIFVVNSSKFVDNSLITGNINFAPTSLPVQKELVIKDQNIYDYKKLVDTYKDLNASDSEYLCVCPSWDNSSRRKNGASIFINDNQKYYCEWLLNALDKTVSTPNKILFVNAWNEWAEGAYLEPDIRQGFQKSNCHLVVNKINSYNNFKTNKVYNFSNQPNSAKIAYIIHGYYPDILEEFLQKIVHTSEQYDLYISLPKTTSKNILSNILCFYPKANVLYVDNHGRDILPWITFNKLNDFSIYDCVCKLHTKKTLYNIESGNYVRNTSIKSLIGSPNIINDHINTLRDNKNIGMICPHTLKLNLQEWIGSNLKNIYKIYNKNIINLSKYYFCGGTMFWYKPQIFNGLLDILDEKYIIAENEPIGVDGNIVHAIERILGMYCIDQNFLIKETEL
jgi:lipopolysaccharide biosynthesis protein